MIMMIHCVQQILSKVNLIPKYLYKQSVSVMAVVNNYVRRHGRRSVGDGGDASPPLFRVGG